MKFQQAGFVHTVLIVGSVLGLIGILGFIFWQNAINKEPVAKDTEIVSRVPGSDSETKSTSQEPVYSLQDAMDDIKKVVSSEGCEGSGASEKSLSFEQVSDQGEFSGKNVINKELTHAYLTYGCGSQGVVALLKKEGDFWILLNEDARIYPMCDIVRKQDFPSSIVDKCYENDRSTEPVKI